MASTATHPPDLAVVAPTVAPAIETVVEDYLTHCKASGLSPKTVTFAYGYPLRHVFLPWCAREVITEPGQLSSRLLERFSAELLEKGGKKGPLSKQSVLTYTRTVNHFLAWAHKEGEMPAVKAKQPPVPKKLMDVLSRQEIEAMEDFARTERDKLIVRVLGDTGIRLGELIGLRTGDIVERSRKHYLHVTGKGQRDRLVPIKPALYQRLSHYVAKSRPKDAGTHRLLLAQRRSPRGDYEPLTGSGVNQLISTVAQLAGIKKRVYPHLLRHSFATWSLSRGVNPVQLKDILGHSSLVMISNVYSHLTPEDAHSALMAALLREE